MKHLTNNNDFKEIIKKGLWLVDFSASWCGPCRMLEPNLEELSKEHNVLKIDIDQFPDLANEFGIMSVPSLLIFENGVFKKMSVGYHNIDQLKKILQ